MVSIMKIKGIFAAAGAALCVCLLLAGCAGAPSGSQQGADTALPTDDQPAVEQPTAEQPAVDQPTVEQPAIEEAPADDAGTSFETPYYRIDLPDSWADSVTFTYDDSYTTSNEGLGLGYSTSVMSKETGKVVFSVTCFTDAWGPQGPFYASKLGTPLQLKGNYVSVYHQMFDEDQTRLPDNTAEYAQYVTIK